MFRCDSNERLVAAFGSSFLSQLLTSCRVVNAPHGVTRVCHQARHRVFSATQAPPSSRPGLHTTIPPSLSVVMSPISTLTVGPVRLSLYT